jgi:hypothetical protein
MSWSTTVAAEAAVAPAGIRTSQLQDERSRPAPWVRALSLGIPLLLALGCAVWFLTFTLDDPWVSFRYAWQLAHGHGLVYNHGEAVEGYTNFLWTVLMAGVIKVGGDPLVWAKVIGIGLHLAATGGVWWCARRMLRDRPALGATAVEAIAGLAAGSYAILLFAGMWSAAALETPLFTALLVAALAAFLVRRLALAAVLLFLAAITRPEGLLLFGAFAVVVAATEWRDGRLRVRTLARAVLPFAAPYLAFVAWRVAYYGSPLPNTYYDKTGGTLAHNLDGGIAYLASFAGGLVGVTGGVPAPQLRARGAVLLLAGLAVVGMALVLLALRARRRGLVLALAWLLTNLLDTAYEGGDWMPAFRFLVPTMPFLVLAVWSGLGDTYARLVQGRSPLRRSAAGGLLALAAAAAVGSAHAQEQTAHAQVGWLKPVTEDARIRPNDAYYAAAQWLHAHLPAGRLVAIEEAGLIPYFNEQLSFLDLFGLTDKHLARAPGEPPFGKQDNAYVLARAPQYAVLWIIRDGSGRMTWAPHLSLLENPEFQAQYVRIAVLPRGADSDFWVFQRRAGG